MLEDVVEKAAYARPGYTLADFKEVGLPAYVITARVLTMEKKPLSAIEEGCLRAIEAGLTNPADISDFLGLSLQILKGVLAALNSREQISYIRPVGKHEAYIRLTEKGRTVLTDAQSIGPEERLVRLIYDPLLRTVVFVPFAALFGRREVKERGWLEMPLCGTRRPEVEDIPLGDIDRAVQRMPRASEEMRELLAVRRIERRELQFIPAIALYYRSNTGQDVQVAFYRDEGFSIGHETAFSELGGPELVGANHLLQPTARLNVLDAEWEDSVASKLGEVDALERIIAAAELPAVAPSRSDEEPARQEALRRAEEARNQLRAMTQRGVRCHEHPKLLRDALTGSQERLLIISPWITHQVVDDHFIGALETLLRSGVKVYLGYGLADEQAPRGADKATQREPISQQLQNKLDGLRKRYSNFVLKFVGNTHRKMLISDTRFAVVTSFNWLSFRGDPRKKARDEFGVLVSEPKMLADIFQDGLALIRDGYDHPPRDANPPSKRTAAARPAPQR